MSVVPFKRVDGDGANKRRVLNKDEVFTYGPCIIKIDKKGLRASDFPPDSDLNAVVSRVACYVKSGHVAVLDAEKDADSRFTSGYITFEQYKYMIQFFDGAPMVWRRIREMLEEEKV